MLEFMLQGVLLFLELFMVLILLLLIGIGLKALREWNERR